MMRTVVRCCALLACVFPMLARSQNVVISELMYDSITHGTNQEWIELHNAGTTPVPLGGWKITKGVSFTFPPGSLYPGEYLVIAADPVWFTANHPSVDPDLIKGGWSGALANGGETIRLEDASGNVVDEVSYADEGDWAQRIRGPVDNGHRGWDWFAPHRGTGKSVERINPRLREDSGQNWAASVADGGTPGAVNSRYNLGGKPLILDTRHLPLVPRSTNSITITARVIEPTASLPVVRLFHRVDANPQTSPFTATPMFDNGAHGDGAAGDGVYGAVLPPHVSGTVIEYFVEAVSDGGETNRWPAPASIDGVLSQSANALLQVDNGTYAGTQPIYRIIMTEAERQELATLNNTSGERNSDAQMNATFVTLDGTSEEVRYLAGVRIRGAGSRGANPPNYRVNLPSDRPWKDISQINLNTQSTHAQVAGYALATRAGLPTEDARAVQVRVNGANLASSTSPQFGSYVAIEPVNGDFVDNHFPEDNDGNVYRASTGSHSATLAHLGSNVISYVNSGYAKQNNVDENDWRDLMGLTLALSPQTPDSNYVARVREFVNVEEWALYFALHTLTLSGETALGTGYGDDYSMYRGARDTRFLLLAHDWDTILGQGSGANFSTGTNLFRATAVASINRFLKHPEFAPVYYATLKRLLDTSFSEAQATRTVDDVLSSWVPANVVNAMKTFITNRNTYVRSQIPLRLSVAAPFLPVVGGYPQSSSATISLNGVSDAINTRTVLVNGSTSVWSAWEARWTNNNVSLLPGLNRVWVQALNGQGVEIGRTNIDVWFSAPGTPVSGTLTGSNAWLATNGPFVVSGALNIPNGATLYIEPGASVFFNAGASLNVANGGTLLAEGTPHANIRFTRVPNTAGTWGGILINGAPGSPESRIRHAHIEFNNTHAVNVQGGALFIEHTSFGTTDRRYLNLDGASFVVSQCYFPATTASLEPIHANGGIRAGGHGIFVRNFFGKVMGYNDTIDFTGGNRPGPVVQFLDNVFMGSDDDVLDLDGTDAWVEGNIFLHVHRNGSPDSASGVSGGNDSGQTSEITIVGNIFYDVDHAATAKQGNFYTFINNTVVRQTGAGFADAAVAAVLNFADDGFALASGMYAEANLIVDAERLTRAVTNGTALASNVTFHNNLMPFTWSGTGTNNSSANPVLTYLPQLSETTNFTTWQQAQVLRDWFKPRAGSPALGRGPHGRDIGGVVPIGAYVGGEPPALTADNAATLSVGINRSGTGFPEGSGYTHYRWRLNSGTWSAETPISTPITLSGLPNGAHRVEVAGRRDTGLYQDDPRYGPVALVSTSRVWVVTNLPGKVVFNEVLARNVSAFQHDDGTPDAIELFNPGVGAVNLSGKRITDDPAFRDKFIFPPGTTLGAGQYLIVFADDSKNTNGLHLGFTLSAEGDALYLYDSVGNGGALLDSIAFGLQLENLSIGRLEDGTWGLTHPTLGARNAAHPLGSLASLKLNEWLTDSLASEDFVEVFNRDTLPVNIGGALFSDTPAGLPSFHVVPPLSFLPANSYFAFIADGEADNGAEHLGFKLSPDQGVISLYAPDGALIDCVLYGPQSTEVSEGRTPNGAETRAFFVVPSPGAPNPSLNSIVVITNVSTNVFGVVNQLWRFDASGTDRGTTWRSASFDDSGWETGFGLFGSESSAGLYPHPFNTFVPAPSEGGPTTVYYRTRFQWSGGSGWQLITTNYIDDGAAFYLNGVELGRVRLSANANFNTFATTQQPSEGQAEVFTFSGAALVDGENILQVEVHQSSGSSDDVFGMSLTAAKFFTNSISTSVVLNEVMANNQSFTNADGTITDWVELYNPGASALDLSGMTLQDGAQPPNVFVFPAGVSIPAGGFLVVKFDSSLPASTNASGVLNSGFGFSSGGDLCALFDSPARGGGQLDSVRFGIQAADFSIGRIPNGSGAWGLTLPTESSPNIPAALGDARQLRINEWMADPRSGDDYFELFNPNPQPVAIGGLYLTDNLNNRTQYRIPNLSFIGVGVRGFVEFRADSNPENGADHANFRLSASGESLGVFGADGLTAIDQITFGPQQRGVSEGRFPDGATNITRFPNTPTPGQANFLPFNDIVISEVLSHTDLPLEDAIELHNPTASPIDISGWYLSDSQLEPRKFRIPNNTILPPGGFVVFYERDFNPTLLFPSFSLSSANGDEVFLSVTDTNGNLTGYRASVDFGPQFNGVSFGRYETSVGFDFPALGARTFGVNNPASVEQFRTGQGASNAGPRVGPVVVTEIHYNPPQTGTNENLRDEFIELYNTTAGSVALYDPAHPANTWHIRDAVDFDFPPGVIMAPNSFLLLVSFDPTNTTELAAFRARYSLPVSVPVYGPWDGALNNGDDEVRVNIPDAPNDGDAPYVLLERVHYRDSAPWPSAADGNTNGLGLSLQRQVPSSYGNDPANWFAGAPTPGALGGAPAGALPAINTPPASQTVAAGTPVTFTVAAAGAGPLRYQWRYQGFDIPNATNASYAVSSAQFSNAGAYSVRVMNAFGAVVSSNAILAIQSEPQIVFQPRDQVIAVGSTARFAVGARGSQPLTFQWLKNGSPISGATQPLLLLSNAQNADVAGYSVVVSNAFGALTSAVAQLQISLPPQIVAQPQSRTAIIGQTVSFNVSASGSAPLAFQWYFEGVPLAGATSSNLVFSNVQPSRSGNYHVVVTNLVGSAISTNVTLVVIVPPTVTIQAVDDTAAESGSNPGAVVITRNSGNNVPLTVNYAISGTAQNGADYQALGSSVVIPAGTNAVTLVVQPIDDNVVEASETVRFTLTSAPEYLLTSSSNATVTLLDDDNLAPAIAIVTPTNGTFLPSSPTNVSLTATVSDPNAGQAVRVDFLFGTNVVGAVLAAPYQFTWTNPPAGSNLLRAVATDALGLSTTSAPVALTINGAPVVTITTPANGALVPNSGTVVIAASATDTNGGVAEVEFFLDGTLAGRATNAPFSLPLTNPALRAYQVFAVARDPFGLSATSSVVNFTVTQPSANFGDLFANRGFITGYTNFRTANNSSATRENGEPNHWTFSTSSRSLWISWTAPGAGVVTIDLAGSSFDTVLAVYTNHPSLPASLASLIKIAESDDNGSSLQSRVQFTNAVPGTVFHIAVDGYSGAAGNISMSLSMPNSPPAIIGAPASITVDEGSNVVFNVVVNSPTTPTYQWRFNGVNISGATAATLTLPNVQASQAGQYDVRVANQFGAVTSAVALLTVRTTQTNPVTLRQAVFANGSFSAALDGMAPNRRYAIEVSLNLTNWTALSVVSNSTGRVNFGDTNPPPFGVIRAYRARMLP